jgi:serine/threonine protein phosphatase PrpC
MITCPQCGQAAADSEKFCARCGQGLAPATPSPAGLRPIPAGTVLKGGFEIVELIAQTSDENRYRATRKRDGKAESFQLRERLGPGPRDGASEPAQLPIAASAAPQTVPAPQDDPNGPHAKTAELKMPPQGAAPVAAADQAADAAAAGLAAADEQSPAAEQPEPAAANDRADTAAIASGNGAATGTALAAAFPDRVEAPSGDLGDLFGRVMSLSLTVTYNTFVKALEGFANGDRVYLVYPDEKLTALSRHRNPMREYDAIGAAVQVCQAIGYMNRRGLRLNDICPESIAYASDGRIRITSLDSVSNDLEIQSDPIFNDGYTAPEIYRGKAVDKRADVFSAGCLLYTMLTSERIASESWREEAGPVSFYPPHVMSPALEQVIRRAIAFRKEDRWRNADAMKAELVRLNSVVRLRSGGLTDVGMVRELNEDSLMIVEYSRDSQVEAAESYLYVVSDGMGGAEAGEMASAIAVATIREYIGAKPAIELRADPGAHLQAALEAANRKILDYAAEHPQSKGMGATGVAILALPPQAAVAWVGDSRGYLYASGELLQVTKDHSLVQRLVEIGQITPEEARYHEHKNVITRSLGARQQGPAGAEVVTLKLKRGDRLILCSDGLTAHVEDREIMEVIGRHRDPLEAARELVVAANAGGGTDNISVIAVFAE